MAERVRLRPSSPPPQPSFGGLKQWRCVRPCPSSPPPQPSFGGLKQWRSVYAHAPPQPSFGGAWCYAALCIRPRPSSSAVVWWFETMAERSTYAPPPHPLLNRCLAEQGATLHSVYAHAPPPQQLFGGLKQWRNGPPTPLLPAPSSTVVWRSGVLCRALYTRPGSTVNILYIRPLPFERRSLVVTVLCVRPCLSPPSMAAVAANIQGT